MLSQGKIWFITGVTRGIGKALAAAVLAHGDTVIGTVKEKSQIESFRNLCKGQSFALQMDIKDSQQIRAATTQALQLFGRIDVVVSDSGYGFLGAVEESDLKEVHDLMDVNFFGSLQVVQAFLPLLRAQGQGLILQMSSGAGIRGSAGMGAYNASKFAIEGLTEALALEMAVFGVRVVLVQTGPMRTSLLARKLRRSQRSLKIYEGATSAGLLSIESRQGKQSGDPERAAQALLRLSGVSNPPLRFALGRIAVATIRAKIEQLQKELDAWSDLSFSVDFPENEGP